MKTNLILIVFEVIALACGSAHGQESSIRWQIVGPPAISPSVLPSPVLDFQILGNKATAPECDCDGIVPCSCGPDCKCKTSATSRQKPVVFAYKDFNLVCPGCVRLSAMEDKLPVKLVWKPAPSWVQSYPSLHWQGADAKWYQYRWGQSSDDLAVFSRNFTATVGPK